MTSRRLPIAKGNFMPAPTTNDELLALIRKSELVPVERLETFIQQIMASEMALTPKKILALFVGAGLLSHFQAEQLLLGKWRGFTIGKYRVLERLGSGGMGTVYLCEHMVVRRKVAIKVLPISQSDNPVALGRFYREARAAGVLDHPNLVKAHDVDQEGGMHYLIMDYVDGANLQEIVTRFGPLAVSRAVHYIRQAALGLQHAHQAGLVHRDIKPANILVDRGGTVRVLDMGLARFMDPSDLLTVKYDHKNVLGSADYVAPEQALNSHEVDIRADIYSLGATFYYTLTGKPPFPTGKVAQKLIWHQVKEPTPVRELRPEVPEEVVAIISRMMAKDPVQRYQTPGEVAEALTPWTTKVIAPPAEAEMPRLCPAVVRNSSTADINLGMATPQRFPRPVNLASRGIPTLIRPAQVSPSGSSLATPRTLCSASDTRPDRIGENEGLRSLADLVPAPAPPSAEVLVPAQAPAPTAAPQGLDKRFHLLWVGAILFASALAGVVLRWSTQRSQTPAELPPANATEP
jgi:serine/threonine protein kinase